MNSCCRNDTMVELQVVAHVTPTLRVITFVAPLERFVEDPPTTVDFLVLVLQTYLSSTANFEKTNWCS